MNTQMKALILQGGGALGAYQAGVFERLVVEDMLPDWVIGTSIGAINGAIIAGNRPEDRVAKLRSFWAGMAPASSAFDLWPPLAWADMFNPYAAMMGMMSRNGAVMAAMKR